MRLGRMLILTMAFFSSIGLCDVYQWVDKNGVKQYSDSPPPKGTAFIKRSKASLPPVLEIQSVKPLQQRKGTNVQKPMRNAAIPTSRTSTTSNRKGWDCGWVKARLDNIQSQLRAGYSNNQGNYLRKERQKYREIYYRECR